MALTTSWLVWYWKFDESSGNASDSTGNWRTLTNNGTCTYSAGILNNAVTTWTSKWMSIASNLWLSGSSQNFTFTFWIKPTSTISTQQEFIQLIDSINHIQVDIDWFSGNLRFIRTRLWVASDICSVAQTFSGWTTYCISAKYDGSSLSIRVNNGSATTIASVWNWTTWWTSWFSVGAAWWGSLFYIGQIDELAWYNRALTSWEETNNYNSGTPPSYPSSDSNFFAFF